MYTINLSNIIFTVASVLLIPVYLHGQITECPPLPELEINGIAYDAVNYNWDYSGDATYSIQMLGCSASFGINCPPDLWTEIPDAFVASIFEPCNTYSFRMKVVCNGNTSYSNVVDYFFENETCNTCNYADWLYQEWFWDSRCDYGCLTSIELIEANGVQYVASWGMYLGCTCGTHVYNCDGSVYCSEGGIVPIGSCEALGIANNYTVIEKIWDRYEDCNLCEEACDICTMPPDHGACYAYGTERWYYNSLSNQCEIFGWSGCGGNANNFASYELCMQGCGQQSNNNCPLTLDLETNTLYSGTYKSQENIISAGKIEVGQQVIFKAGNNIKMSSGFSTRGASNFKTQIQNCE